MTAYGAVISLKNTIHHILSSPRLSFVKPSLNILRLAYMELQPLQELLTRLDSTSKSRNRKKVNALDGRIKEALWNIEDILESLLSNQIVSQFESPQDQLVLRGNIQRRRKRIRRLFYEGLLLGKIGVLFREEEEEEESYPVSKSRSSWEEEEEFDVASEYRSRWEEENEDYQATLESEEEEKESDYLESRSSRGEDERDENLLLFSIDLQSLQYAIDSFVQALKDMEEEYIYEVENMPKDIDTESLSSRTDSSSTKSKMIGLSDEFKHIKKFLLLRSKQRRMCVYTLVGMAGVGKSTLAQEVYQDPEIITHFECRAWVTVSRTPPQLDQISQGILTQLFGIRQGGNDQDQDRLVGKSCLVVLDDVWEPEVLALLLSSLPNLENGVIEILLTTRDVNVLESIPSRYWSFSFCRPLSLLDEETSMELLCDRVFGENIICPPQLENAARKIAKICEGLPLMIVAVANHLSNRDLDYWNEVAEERNSVFTDVYAEISDVLFPSYDYLPQNLKIFFLFLGLFPRDYEIPLSKIMNMLTAEGWFLDTCEIETPSLQESVSSCLRELCGTYYIVSSEMKSFHRRFTEYHGRRDTCYYKSCRLHCAWRYLCSREARKNKLYHVLNRLIDDELEEGIKGQRCLSLQNNILFAIKEFCNSVRCKCASSTRFLLFLGPYHQYPIPIDVDFKFLRELDALNLRFYIFPTQILTLVLLKYLALTYNGQLPATISKLFNLQFLIIHPHTNIKRLGARAAATSSCIPIQIWDMLELQHIEILGKSLATPDHFLSLGNLTTLVGVNASICTISNLCRRIPRLRKLGVKIELGPDDDDGNILSCFRCISTLESLETLKCSILNPVLVEYGRCIASTTPSPLMLPGGLANLHLSGMCFPWEYMDAIGSLQHLEVLKLRSYAFRGSTWETQENSFRQLRFLLIEDSDLVQWKPSSGSFPVLSYVVIKHCYKLQEFYWSSRAEIANIELIDCSPLALAYANQMKPNYRNASLFGTVSSSFGEQPMTVDFER